MKLLTLSLLPISQKGCLPMLEIRNVLKSAEKILIENHIKFARLEAEIFLMNVLNVERIFLYTHDDKILNDEQIKNFYEMIERRISHEPAAYIIGHKNFMNLNLIVNENVLIPRPETEILVEEVIKRLKNLNEKIQVADIGTGSGAIALSIAQFLPNAFVDAVDINQKTLDIAKSNASKNNLSEKINFHLGDLLNPLKNKKFHAIVSNPPYIPTEIIDSLQVEVAKYEPRIALDGGEDGLNFYRRLIEESPKFLQKNGFLAVNRLQSSRFN